MQNSKPVKKNSSNILQLSFYIQLQVLIMDMDWLHHMVGVWSARLIVWSAIFMAGSILRHSEIKEDYQ